LTVMMAPESFKTGILLFRQGLNNVRPSENNVGAEGPSGNFSPENKTNDNHFFESIRS
jgi:ABC-type fe3+-hydroxamate transport system,periplasmic component